MSAAAALAIQTLLGLLRDADWLVDIEREDLETPAGAERRMRVHLRLERDGSARRGEGEGSPERAFWSAFWAAVFGCDEVTQLELRDLWLKACGVG